MAVEPAIIDLACRNGQCRIITFRGSQREVSMSTCPVCQALGFRVNTRT